MSAGLVTSMMSEAELYFLQQDYRTPTRLPDWTASPLAPPFLSLFVPRHQLMRLLSRLLLTLPAPTKEAQSSPDLMLSIRSDQFDRRVSLLRGCFTFHATACGAMEKMCIEAPKGLHDARIDKTQSTCGAGL